MSVQQWSVNTKYMNAVNSTVILSAVVRSSTRSQICEKALQGSTPRANTDKCKSSTAQLVWFQQSHCILQSLREVPSQFRALGRTEYMFGCFQ